MTKFTYPLTRVAAINSVCVAAAFGFGSVDVLVIFLLIFSPSTLVGNRFGFVAFVLLLMACAVACIVMLVHFYNAYRPLLVGEDGISALDIGGRVQKTIKWSDVVRIDKIWTFDVVSRSNRHFFEIHSPTCIVYFNDTIRGYDRLLRVINRYIALHHIPVHSCDRSPDAIREIVRSASDPDERKRLVRTGRVRVLTSL